MKSYNAYLKKVVKKDPSLKKGMKFESWLLEVSLNIARLRKERGYSQEEFANKLVMSQSAVARIESGQNMKCSTIWKISDVLEVNLELFGVDKETEKRKVETFCESPIEDKEIFGVTAKEDEIQFLTQPSSINFNPINYGYSY